MLVHLFGGRIEAHFSRFIAVAVLGLYRSVPVAATMVGVSALDLFVRGIFWPMSVFGENTPGSLRWFEHSFWLVAMLLLTSAFIFRLDREGRTVRDALPTGNSRNES